MTIEKLREVHRFQPFRPFNLHLADGGQIPVSRPESLAHSPSGRTIVAVSPDDTAQLPVFSGKGFSAVPGSSVSR